MTAHDSAAGLAALRARAPTQPCPDGRRPVLGPGSVTPRLCIVGDGPAERDEAIGRPFSGPAGELLMRVPAEAGVDPEAVWFTNVLKSAFLSFARFTLMIAFQSTADRCRRASFTPPGSVRLSRDSTGTRWLTPSPAASWLLA